MADKSKTTTINLPDVNDIPGQENIQPAPLGELADTTASSDDEEGRGVLDDDEQTGGEDNVSDVERDLLDEAANADPAYEEDRRAREAEVDIRDDEGELLNEGEELDVPGAELDDTGEETGSEDEENNPYSLGDTD
ncbi:hypothetical protein ACWKWU_16305 [Chitinophaga lutea]